ncbi:hypothetical protein Prudu_006006, partial [Prunus dulcis]
EPPSPFQFFAGTSDGENFAVRPPFEAPFLAKASSLPPLPSPPLFSDRKPGKRRWRRRENQSETADVADDVSGHLELRRHLEQVLRPRIRSRRDPLRVKQRGTTLSGPGIGVMSEQRRGPLWFPGNSGAGPVTVYSDRNCAGNLGLLPEQKFTAVIRMLAYGSSADQVDEIVGWGSPLFWRAWCDFVMQWKLVHQRLPPQTYAQGPAKASPKS